MNIAYGFATNIPPPISPAVNIEMDTYDNGAGLNDIPDDHIAINRDGSLMAVIMPAVTAKGNAANIEDSVWHEVEINWDPVIMTLQVYFDCELRQTMVNDIVTNVFSGNPLVYYGFTASTGLLKNQQKFLYLIHDAGTDVT